MHRNSHRLLLVGLALVASAGIALPAPVGMVETPAEVLLFRDGVQDTIRQGSSFALLAGDRLVSGDVATRARLLNGTGLLLGPASSVAISPNSVTSVERGLVVVSLPPGQSVQADGLVITGLNTESPTALAVDRKRTDLVEVSSLSGGAVVVLQGDTGDQLGIIMQGDVLNFEKRPSGIWLVQSPMVLQMTEGVEDTTETDDSDAAAAGAAAGSGTGGAGGGAPGGGGAIVGGNAAAIGGGVVIVGGGVAVAASPRLRQALGLSSTSDDDDEPSSPVVPPPSQPPTDSEAPQ